MKRTGLAVLGINMLAFLVSAFFPAQDNTIVRGPVEHIFAVMGGAKRFCERMRSAGNTCEMHVYQGFGHLFTPAGIPDDDMPKPDPAISADAAERANSFLKSLGFLR